MSLQETAYLAESDAELLKEMEGLLRDVDWQISACGKTAVMELKKVEELAPRVIKAMVNYI